MMKTDLKDPRRSKGFQPLMFPLCDGDPAPPMAKNDPVGLRMIEFASAYYLLNILYERLKRSRLQESSEDPATILAEIDAATHARDSLEDSYAPEGFYAEPIIEGLMTVNLIFSHALKRQLPHLSTPASSFSLFVPIPEPGVDVEAHLRKHFAGLFGLSPNEGNLKSDLKAGGAVKRKRKPGSKSNAGPQPTTKPPAVKSISKRAE